MCITVEQFRLNHSLLLGGCCYICYMHRLPAHTNNLLQQHFDKVLVLTVDRFTGRQRRIKQRLKGIDFEFFYGTDKLLLTTDDIEKNYHYDPANSLSVAGCFKPMTTGEIACAISHREIYETMLLHNWQHILVLEDDAVPNAAEFFLLQHSLEQLPADWELLYLGYSKNSSITPFDHLKKCWYRIQSALGFTRMPFRRIKNCWPKYFSTHLYKAGFHDCTHAYAISRSAAAKLLQAQTPVQHRADNLLSSLILDEQLKAFACKQQFFTQETGGSAFSFSMIREPQKKFATRQQGSLLQ